MKKEEIRAGDICILDESVDYPIYHKEPFNVIVLWTDYSQPLVTKTTEYNPTWTTYNQLTKIVGHIAIEQILQIERKEK